MTTPTDPPKATNQYGAVYRVEFNHIGRTYIDWSDPESVSLSGTQHGKIKLIEMIPLSQDGRVKTRCGCVIALKEAGGTHWGGINMGRDYHSPQVSVWMVPERDGGDKGWAFKLIDWEVTRGKRT